MNYVIQITNIAKKQQALEFCQQVLAAGDKLSYVFFYGPAVQLVQDCDQWDQLDAAETIPKILCSKAVEQYLPNLQLPSSWQIAGLGSFIEQLIKSDRCQQF